jgi:single-strand DNA-binding protein
MTRGLNRVDFIGNLAREPEFRYDANGLPMATATLAVNGIRNRPDGEREESVEYFRLIFFDKSAETVGRLCSKGGGMWVTGRLQTRQYTDREGQARTAIEVVVREFMLLYGHNKARKEGEGNNE